MRVLAITNRKGGAGKTTVAVNLAAELAGRGQRVLLVDLDSQGHCAVGLGHKPAAGSATVHGLFEDPGLALSDVVVPTALDNLWLAPANPLFDHGAGERNPQRLRQALRHPELEARFDLAILDTPPSLDNLLLNALVAADRVIVPYVPHPLSYDGVRQLSRVLFRVMTGSNRTLKILGFVPNVSADHIRQHRQVTGDVGHQFGHERLLPAIRNDIRLAEAFAAGQPIQRYAPRTRGAEDFAALATEVLRRLA